VDVGYRSLNPEVPQKASRSKQDKTKDDLVDPICRLEVPVPTLDGQLAPN